MYPRSAGGLEGRLRPAVRGGMTLWKRAHDGSEFNSSFSFFFFFFFKHRSKFAHHLLHTLPERAGDALDSYAFCIFFVFCFLFFVVALLYLAELHLHSDTATISPWAITFFSLSKRILKNLTEQGKKKKKSWPALSCPQSLSCMSTICLRQCLLHCLFAQPQQSPL